MDVSHGEPVDQLAGADETDGGAGKSRQERVVEAAAVAQTETFAVEGEPGHEGHGTDEVGGMHFTRGVVRGFFHAEGAAHEPSKDCTVYQRISRVPGTTRGRHTVFPASHARWMSSRVSTSAPKLR